MFTFVDDIGQPYTCSDWGELDEPNIPIMVDDGLGYILKTWFGNASSNYPYHIFIDHQMKLYEVYNGGLSQLFINTKINEMLLLMGN